MVVWWYHTILRWYHTAWSSFSLVYYHHHIIWRWFADGPPQPCQYHHHMEKERHGHGDGPSDAAVASAIDNNFSLEEETTAKRTDLEICHEPPLSNEMTPTTNILTFRQHLTEIVQLTIPIILSEIFQNTLPIIDLAFVGRLGHSLVQLVERYSDGVWDGSGYLVGPGIRRRPVQCLCHVDGQRSTHFHGSDGRHGGLDDAV